jgi:hypothetical protein
MRGFRHISLKARVDREGLNGRVGIGYLTSIPGKKLSAVGWIEKFKVQSSKLRPLRKSHVE